MAYGAGEREDSDRAAAGEEERTLYLLWIAPEDGGTADPIDLHGDGHPLADGLWLIRSGLSRSKLYHRIKWQLPGGTALLLAPLADTRAGWPKFKGMEAGALAWLRAGGGS